MLYTYLYDQIRFPGQARQGTIFNSRQSHRFVSLPMQASRTCSKENTAHYFGDPSQAELCIK